MAYETTEGASSEYEMTESMEVVDDRSLRKRKAETHDLKDHSDGGGSGESGVGSGENSVGSGKSGGGSGGEGMKEKGNETEPEWGYDSFEGGYFSLPEPEYSDSEEDEEAKKKLREYRRHIYANEGFYIDRDMIPSTVLNPFCPVDLDETSFYPSDDQTALQYMESMVKLALDKYNQEKNTNVKCKCIVRAVIRMATGLKCYITFIAETPGGELVEYQAKTEWKYWHKKAYPIFCRPSPGPRDLKRKTDEVEETQKNLS